MVFRYDWFADVAQSNFEKYLFKYKGQPGLYFLEIGCFEGMATVWLIKNILTDPTSRMMTVDTFMADSEDLKRLNLGDTYPIFIENTKGYESKIDIIKGMSQDVLRMDSMQNCRFDFAYIDGSHRSQDVMLDAIQSFRLLKKGGILAFDDYLWKWQGNDEIESPGIAIDAFLKMYAREIKVLSGEKEWQVWVEKL